MVLIFTGLQVHASEIFESNRSLRSLGMGGAYIAITSPEDAPVVNPAALGFVHEIKWELINVGFGAGAQGIPLDENIGSTFRAIDSPDDYSQFFGKKLWVDVNGKTSLVMPNFGISSYNEIKTDFVLHNPAYPQLNVNFINDYGVNLAGAIALGTDSYFGLGIKRVNRWGGNQDIGLGIIAAGQGQAILDQFQNKGVGYGFDTAYITKIPGSVDARFTVVWQDVGDTKFSKTAGAEAPPAIENNLSVGLGTLVDLPGLDMAADIEIRHLMNSAYSFGQKVHMGAEFSLPLIDIRAGLSQGYPSYGLGLSFLFMDLEAAYYFTELGEYPGQSPQNRIQLSLSMGFSVDADFKFYSKDGKRRKLKQRR